MPSIDTWDSVPDGVGDGGEDKEKRGPDDGNGVGCQADKVQGQAAGSQREVCEKTDEGLDSQREELQPAHGDVDGWGTLVVCYYIMMSMN